MYFSHADIKPVPTPFFDRVFSGVAMQTFIAGRAYILAHYPTILYPSSYNAIQLSKTIKPSYYKNDYFYQKNNLVKKLFLNFIFRDTFYDMYNDILP